MAKKYLINPLKHNYDPQVLNKYQRSLKAASELVKIPDRFWTQDNSEQLIDYLSAAWRYAKELSTGTAQKLSSKRPFFFSKNKEEQLGQINGIIDMFLRIIPAKRTENQSAILHKLNLEKAFILKKK